jgi:cleavage and polyadenylation specificity factor subunit 4
MSVDIQESNGSRNASISPQQTAPLYDFSFNDFLRREYRFGISPDRPICKSFLQGHCPLGNTCPDKHYTQPSFNRYPQLHSLWYTHSNTVSSIVCKHWMRALCKKGEHCEFLHEFNVRRMPECNNYSRYGTCPNGDDCMYQHIEPASKRPPCPHYDRGFCPLGPLCANRHVRKERICPFYMAGFCPNGKECKEGTHAKFPKDLKKPVVMGTETEEQTESGEKPQEMAYEPEPMERFERDDRGGQKSGRGGKWQQRGGRGRGGFKRRGG